MNIKIGKYKKQITVGAILMVMTIAILGSVMVYQVNYRLGMDTDLWAHFYLGNTDRPLVIEVDYEEGHPIPEGLMERLVLELRKVCDRPVVYVPAYTHQVDIPDDVLDLETDQVRTEYIRLSRTTIESWDTLYIILTNNDYVIDDDYMIAGFFVAPGSMLVMQRTYDMGVDFYTIIHEFGHAVGLGHYDDECYMNAVLDPLNPPQQFSLAALNDMDDIRGYYYRGEDGLMLVILWLIPEKRLIIFSL